MKPILDIDKLETEKHLEANRITLNEGFRIVFIIWKNNYPLIMFFIEVNDP